MLNFIGHLYGSKVYLDVNCVDVTIGFKRKQTRKFKNRRWVKKYLKKYSYEIRKPSIAHIHDQIIMHPKVWEAIKEKENEIKRDKDYTHRSFRRNQEGIQGHDRQREFGAPTFGMGQRTFGA